MFASSFQGNEWILMPSVTAGSVLGHYRPGSLTWTPHESDSQRKTGADAQGLVQKKPFHVSHCHQRKTIFTQAFYPRRFSEQMEKSSGVTDSWERDEGPRIWSRLLSLWARGPNITDAIQQTAISQSHSQSTQSLTWATILVKTPRHLHFDDMRLLQEKIAWKMNILSFTYPAVSPNLKDFLPRSTKQGI